MHSSSKVTSVRDLTPSQQRLLSQEFLDPGKSKDVHQARKKLREEGVNVSFPAVQKFMTKLQRKKRRRQSSSSQRDGDPSFMDSHVPISAGRAR